MRLIDLQRAVESCFRPEFRQWASVLTAVIERNPEGWETWLALKADVQAEERKAHRHTWRRWDSFGDYGWYCDGCCAMRDEEPGADL